MVRNFFLQRLCQILCKLYINLTCESNSRCAFLRFAPSPFNLLFEPLGLCKYTSPLVCLSSSCKTKMAKLSVGTPEIFMFAWPDVFFVWLAKFCDLGISIRICFGCLQSALFLKINPILIENNVENKSSPYVIMGF